MLPVPAQHHVPIMPYFCPALSKQAEARLPGIYAKLQQSKYRSCCV